MKNPLPVAAIVLLQLTWTGFVRGMNPACGSNRCTGEKWFDGCQWCVCYPNGPVCSTEKCSSLVALLPPCTAIGSSWRDGSYYCTCSKSGITCEPNKDLVHHLWHEVPGWEDQSQSTCTSINDRRCVCDIDGVQLCSAEASNAHSNIDNIALPSNHGPSISTHDLSQPSSDGPSLRRHYSPSLPTHDGLSHPHHADSSLTGNYDPTRPHHRDLSHLDHVDHSQQQDDGISKLIDAALSHLDHAFHSSANPINQEQRPTHKSTDLIKSKHHDHGTNDIEVEFFPPNQYLITTKNEVYTHVSDSHGSDKQHLKNLIELLLKEFFKLSNEGELSHDHKEQQDINADSRPNDEEKNNHRLLNWLFTRDRPHHRKTDESNNLNDLFGDDLYQPSHYFNDNRLPQDHGENSEGTRHQGLYGDNPFQPMPRLQNNVPTNQREKHLNSARHFKKAHNHKVNDLGQEFDSYREDSQHLKNKLDQIVRKLFPGDRNIKHDGRKGTKDQQRDEPHIDPNKRSDEDMIPHHVFYPSMLKQWLTNGIQGDQPFQPTRVEHPQPVRVSHNRCKLTDRWYTGSLRCRCLNDGARVTCGEPSSVNDINDNFIRLVNWECRKGSEFELSDYCLVCHCQFSGFPLCSRSGEGICSVTPSIEHHPLNDEVDDRDSPFFTDSPEETEGVSDVPTATGLTTMFPYTVRWIRF
ncbi:uncharacterized protein LOC131941364 [Physella acuta]|uniref:uncharacterized protein LOC131941364 n=1 Tax=Physella acuta TaxID=109671 RepID=UPI0027DE060C|nr:uncharacterized protein LOC131941364 [Physella acuta]XP_059156599.1 uncharacterized protein LOC131941364 [Physella acuta]